MTQSHPTDQAAQSHGPIMTRYPPARLLGWGSLCPSRVRSPWSCTWSPYSAATWWVNHPGAIQRLCVRGLSLGCGLRGAPRAIRWLGTCRRDTSGARGTPVPAAAAPPAPTGGRLKARGGPSAAANGRCRRSTAPPHPGSADSGPTSRREDMEPSVRGWGSDVRAPKPPALRSRFPSLSIPLPPCPSLASPIPHCPSRPLCSADSPGTAPVPFSSPHRPQLLQDPPRRPLHPRTCTLVPTGTPLPQ